MMNGSKHQVIVIGGGMAGLSCAFELQRNDVDVIVIERESKPGGNVRTLAEEGYRYERGPHTFLGSADAVFELVERSGLEDSLINTKPEAKDRFIVRGGKLHKAPAGPWSFLTTSLLSFGAKMKLATEPFRLERGDPEDTATQFFKRRFGQEAGQILAGAFISGVYAGDPDLLSAQAAFPLFWKFEQQTGSMIRGALKHRKERKKDLEAQGKSPRRGLFSFETGLGQITETLAESLGSRCKTDIAIKTLEKQGEGYRILTDHGEFEAPVVVVATPPEPASNLLSVVDPKIAELLTQIPMAPVAVVHLGFDEKLDEIPDGFGFLAPRGEGIRTLGVLFPSRLFDGRTPNGGDLLAGFVGGMTDPEALELDDKTLEKTVLDDLETLTGLEKQPKFVRIRRYQQAIPQFVKGHLDRISEIHDRLSNHQGLFLSGNYLIGVGMKDASASGLTTAAEVFSKLSASSEA